MASKTNLEILCVITWAIWTARNQWIHDSPKISAIETLEKAGCLLEGGTRVGIVVIECTGVQERDDNCEGAWRTTNIKDVRVQEKGITLVRRAWVQGRDGNIVDATKVQER
ncbi:hypothetical protein TIFTF001_007764 [Ficus carica]|uniref:Uncharacterized protein n=1 Tax=Ficus carica TaxID=3494 RepID=A0AA88CZZ0_FICCA|nr:hypothetical protein TIFTF001_007764 [Ficus carica]